MLFDCSDESRCMLPLNWHRIIHGPLLSFANYIKKQNNKKSNKKNKQNVKLKKLALAIVLQQPKCNVKFEREKERTHLKSAMITSHDVCKITPAHLRHNSLSHYLSLKRIHTKQNTCWKIRSNSGTFLLIVTKWPTL